VRRQPCSTYLAAGRSHGYLLIRPRSQGQLKSGQRWPAKSPAGVRVRSGRSRGRQGRRVTPIKALPPPGPLSRYAHRQGRRGPRREVEDVKRRLAEERLLWAQRIRPPKLPCCWNVSGHGRNRRAQGASSQGGGGNQKRFKFFSHSRFDCGPVRRKRYSVRILPRG
jgi:hypothetical protein